MLGLSYVVCYLCTRLLFYALAVWHKKAQAYYIPLMATGLLMNEVQLKEKRLRNIKHDCSCRGNDMDLLLYYAIERVIFVVWNFYMVYLDSNYNTYLRESVKLLHILKSTPFSKEKM